MSACLAGSRVDSILFLCVLLNLSRVGVCLSVSISTLMRRRAWLEAGPSATLPLLILLLARSV